MNSYELSRQFWDWAFENPSKIRPIHCAIYFFAVEHCNRLGWKKEFGLPTSMVIEAIGVKSYRVYKKAFDELIEWKLIDLVEISKNQYSSNVVALSLKYEAKAKAKSKALDKALSKHSTKQVQYNKTKNKQTRNVPAAKLLHNGYDEPAGILGMAALKSWENEDPQKQLYFKRYERDHGKRAENDPRKNYAI